jgi:hypothetical protein
MLLKKAVVTVKLDVLVAVPPGVVTVIVPVVAPVGTVAVIFVSELTMKAAVTPLNLTEVAPVKFVPLIVTVDPTGPDIGENEVMVGAEVAPSTWTNPDVTLWPKKHPLGAGIRGRDGLVAVEVDEPVQRG